MAEKEDLITADGEVIETLPNTMFKVQLDDTDKVILAVIAGRMRKYYIKIVKGDRVKVEFSPYDVERGRIVYRYK